MDPYASCPCGSGKKVKFCCQAILPEMAKIERLQENNQPRMALQLIDKLLKEHPDNGWLVTQRAMALNNDDRFEEARDSLVPFLRKNQDHPLANALLALVVTELEPIDKAKKVVHRAFLKSMAAHPQLCAVLASSLVAHHYEAGNEMATRQHMAIILRLGTEEERQRTLMGMLELDADTSVPYPLRAGHPLPHYEPREELQPQVKKSQRLYVHGCFSEAADLLEKVAEQDPESAELWHTIGLMRAWDGDENRSAEALHRAARLYGDSNTAVDVETVAQLLDRRRQENTVAARIHTYDIESLSRLLTRLDNEDRFSRIPLLEQSRQSGLSAAYEVLDRPLPTDSEVEELTLESAPRSIGRISLFDQSAETATPAAHVSAIEGTHLDRVIELFEAAVGDLARKKEAAEDESPDANVIARYSQDELMLTETAFFPPATPARIRNQLRREFIQRCIDETWMQTGQQALGGKSPAEAAGDEDLKVPLSAAIYVFDAFLDRRDIILDRNALRERLELPPEESIQAKDDIDLNMLSVMQLQRLDLREMSDELFNRVMQRAMIIKHCGHSYRVLNEFLSNRPQLVEPHSEEAQQAYTTLADICVHSLRDEEAFDWLDRGYEFVKSRGANFETLLMWKMRELSMRAKDREDPALKELLLELWNYYGAKLPVVRERLQEFVQVLEIDAPWENAIITPETVSQGGTVWTAEGEQPASEKKLWLPD